MDVTRSNAGLEAEAYNGMTKSRRSCVDGWGFGIPSKVEQEIPRWSTPEARAVMDVVYMDGQGREVCIDVSCIEGSEGGR